MVEFSSLFDFGEDYSAKKDNNADLNAQTNNNLADRQEKKDSGQRNNKNSPYKELFSASQEDIGLDFNDTEGIYNRLISTAQDTISAVSAYREIELNKITEILNNLIDSIIFGDKRLLYFINNAHCDDYFALGMVNSAILAVEVGIYLGYNKSDLSQVALAAFFHDIGLLRVEKIINLPRRLSTEEVSAVKKHPVISKEIILSYGIKNEKVLKAVEQHHERLDSSGYPRNLGKGKISEFAQIIGVIDVFEALTHLRPFRRKFTYPEAFKMIIQTETDKLNAHYIDALIHRVGLYSLGAWVLLSNDLIAKVIDINKDFPLRPVVTGVFDKKGKKFASPKTIDLRKELSLFIVKELTPEDFEKYTNNEPTDKSFLA